MWDKIQDQRLLYHGISSVALLISLLIARFLALRSLRNWNQSDPNTRRTWIVHIRNATVVFLILGLVVIWAEEMRTLAISIVALAAAFVISTKELILCVLGGMLKTGSGSFRIGDRIQILEFRGDVIDHNFFTTTLLEIGSRELGQQYTGKGIVLPNSMFLTQAIINETHGDDFGVHISVVPMLLHEKWKKAEQCLVRAANEECSAFLQDAQKYMDRMSKNLSVETPSVKPRVSYNFPEPERIDLLLRFPAPALRKGKIEQAIIRKYLDYFAGDETL